MSDLYIGFWIGGVFAVLTSWMNAWAIPIGCVMLYTALQYTKKRKLTSNEGRFKNSR